MKKTPRMVVVERQAGEQIETLVPRLLSDRGSARTAVVLGISRSTLEAWMERLGITIVETVLRRGEKVIVQRIGAGGFLSRFWNSGS